MLGVVNILGPRIYVMGKLFYLEPRLIIRSVSVLYLNPIWAWDAMAFSMAVRIPTVFHPVGLQSSMMSIDY